MSGRLRQRVAEPTFRGPRDAMRLADLLNSRLSPVREGRPMDGPPGVVATDREASPGRPSRAASAA